MAGAQKAGFPPFFRDLAPLPAFGPVWFGGNQALHGLVAPPPKNVEQLIHQYVPYRPGFKHQLMFPDVTV